MKRRSLAEARPRALRPGRGRARSRVGRSRVVAAGGTGCCRRGCERHSPPARGPCPRPLPSFPRRCPPSQFNNRSGAALPHRLVGRRCAAPQPQTALNRELSRAFKRRLQEGACSLHRLADHHGRPTQPARHRPTNDFSPHARWTTLTVVFAEQRSAARPVCGVAQRHSCVKVVMTVDIGMERPGRALRSLSERARSVARGIAGRIAILSRRLQVRIARVDQGPRPWPGR